MRIPEKTRRQKNVSAEMQEERNFTGTDYDVYVMEKKEMGKVLLLCVLGAALCGYLYFHSYIAAAAASVCSVFLLPVYKRVKADAAKNDLRIQFRDFLYSVSASVHTGRSLEEALGEACGPLTMIYGDECSMVQELKRMVTVIRDTNCSAEPLLRDLAGRSHIDEISEFVDVCITCRRTGGDIGSLIGKASEIITQNIELMREKNVLLSQKRLDLVGAQPSATLLRTLLRSGERDRALALMPPAVILLINMSSSDYLFLMYTTLEGRLIMTISLLCTAGAFLWSFKLISFD